MKSSSREMAALFRTNTDKLSVVGQYASGMPGFFVFGFQVSRWINQHHIRFGQAVIRSPKASTGPFALMLKSDTAIGTLDAIFIRLDADGARPVKGFSAGARLAIFYASNCIRVMPEHGRLYKVSRRKTNFVVLKVCHAVQSLAKQFQSTEQPICNRQE